MSNQELDYDDVQRMALAFVLEDKSWPVFLSWVRENHGTVAAYEWAKQPDLLRDMRIQWLLHGTVETDVVYPYPENFKMSINHLYGSEENT
jgi:hypothetical protein